LDTLKTQHLRLLTGGYSTLLSLSLSLTLSLSLSQFYQNIVDSTKVDFIIPHGMEYEFCKILTSFSFYEAMTLYSRDLQSSS